MFNVFQQQLRDYVLSMEEMFYVTTALTSVTNVEPSPNASTNIFPHVYEEFVTFV